MTAVRTQTLRLFDELALHADRAVEFHFLGQRSWLLTDPAAAREALAAPPELVTRSPVYRKIAVLLGQTLLTTDGREHRRRRRLIQPAFQPRHMAEYAPHIVASAEATRDEWHDGAVVDVEREMAALTLGAIGAAVLGIDGRAHARRIGAALDRLQRAIALLLVPGAETMLRARVPILRPLLAAIDELHEVAREATGTDAAFLRAMRDADTDGQPLTDDDLRNELLTLLLAGHETTAMTLTWAWWFLDRHRDIADGMRAEHARVLGDRAPAYDDLTALPWTSAVVAETLRLRPPAWIIERQVVSECDLAGLPPPVGTVLLVSPWVLHRDRASWAKPHAFRPERWLDATGRFDESAPGQPRGAWLPFGAGSHVCVGASFGWGEAVLALATLARAWRPERTTRDLPMRATATLRPAVPARMRVVRADETVAATSRAS